MSQVARLPDMRTGPIGRSSVLANLPLHWSFILGGVFFALVVVILGPERLALLPDCPLRSATGLLCPGCGSTRAISAVSQGQFLKALGYNPLAVIFLSSLPLLILLRYRGYKPSANIIWGILGVIVTYFILRNLPLAVFDVLRP